MSVVVGLGGGVVGTALLWLLLRSSGWTRYSARRATRRSRRRGGRCDLAVTTRAHRGDRYGARGGQYARVLTSRPAAHFSRPWYAHHRRAVHFHLGHGHPAVAAAPDIADARPRGGPRHRGPAGHGLRVHAENGSSRRASDAFVGWMAPRGIVAAATASTFGTTLVSKGIGGAREDPARHLPGDCRHGHAVRPDRGAGGAAIAWTSGLDRTRPLLVGGDRGSFDLGLRAALGRVWRC